MFGRSYSLDFACYPFEVPTIDHSHREFFGCPTTGVDCLIWGTMLVRS